MGPKNVPRGTDEAMRTKSPKRQRQSERTSGSTSSESKSIVGALSAEERLLLHEWCAGRGVAVDEPSVDRLGVYRDLLLDWNTRVNLTSMRDPRDVLIKHFLDSLAILPWVPGGEPVLDIGTGAGFPGMVLKLARLPQPVGLVEATGKKIGFLEHLRRVFRLEACNISHRRLIGDEADLRGRFGVVVSRGVQSPGDFVSWAESYLKPGGCILAMTGRAGPSPGLKTEAFVRSTGCRLEHIEQFELPEKAGTRHLLLFRYLDLAANVPRGT
jgi:16S rRNA (guanine527-N7)-methyltransferase